MDITGRIVKEQDVKKEVVDAYNEVMRKLKEANNLPGENLKQKQEDKFAHEKKLIIETVLRETPEDLVRNMSDLKQFVSKTLDNIKAQLLPEYEKFFTVRKAIALSETELNELHQIKVSAGTLTALVQAHKEKMAAHENEVIANRRQFAEEKIQLTKEREKEEAEYIFKRDAARKLDQEKYENSKREVEKALAEKRAAFEEDFEAREARIAAREKEHQQLKEREAWILARDKEYQELKERTSYHSEALRLAVQKAESAVIDKLTSKYEYEAKLLHIELESERRMYQQKIAALQEQIEQYKSLKPIFNAQAVIPEVTPIWEEKREEVQNQMVEDQNEIIKDVQEEPTQVDPEFREEVKHEIKDSNEDILREFLLTN